MPASAGPDNAANRPRLPGPTTDGPEAFGRGVHVDPGDPQQDGARQEGARQDGDPQGGDQKQPDKNGDGDKGGEEKDPRPFWKRPVLMTALVAFFLAATIAGILTVIHEYRYESTDDAFIDGRIVRIAPRVAGKVLAMPIDDNQFVGADDVLVQIDPAPFRVKVDQAAAALSQARAQVLEAEANQKVAEATALEDDADVEVAVANAKNAEQDIARYNRLSKEARTQQEVDQATANQRATEATVDASRKKAAAAHEQAKAMAATVESMKKAVQVSAAQLEQANLDLSYTAVRAGHAGRITRRTVEVGNYIAVGQEILDVVPTDAPADIWVTANFKETQLAHIKPGQRVTIGVDAFPDEKLTGHVDSIQNGTGAVFSLLPPENATGNYVKVVQRVPVKIVLDGHPRHMLSPGMSVEPEVDISERPDPQLTDEPTGPRVKQSTLTQPRSGDRTDRATVPATPAMPAMPTTPEIPSTDEPPSQAGSDSTTPTTQPVVTEP